jgi:hypothetical protein
VKAHPRFSSLLIFKLESFEIKMSFKILLSKVVVFLFPFISTFIMIFGEMLEQRKKAFGGREMMTGGREGKSKIWGEGENAGEREKD